MSLEQASLLAQIISAGAIIASLIFVGVQLRQTARAVRASSSQAHSAMHHSISASIIEDADFAGIWRRSLADPESVSDDEQVRFLAFTSTLFRFYESSRLQWLLGQLDEGHWHMIEAQAIDFAAQPGIQAWWALRRKWHSNEFQDWFENLPKGGAARLYVNKAKPDATRLKGDQFPVSQVPRAQT